MPSAPDHQVRWLAVPRHGDRRVASRVAAGIAVVAAVSVLAGCGKPGNLDRDEQVAFARECASLVERNVADNKPPRQAELGDETLTLDQPSLFYSILERLRGASTYNLHDPKRDADTARQPLDDCNPKLPIIKPKSGSSTTTTSTTTSTVPGS